MTNAANNFRPLVKKPSLHRSGTSCVWLTADGEWVLSRRTKPRGWQAMAVGVRDSGCSPVLATRNEVLRWLDGLTAGRPYCARPVHRNFDIYYSSCDRFFFQRKGRGWICRRTAAVGAMGPSALKMLSLEQRSALRSSLNERVDVWLSDHRLDRPHRYLKDAIEHLNQAMRDEPVEQRWLGSGV